jgi:hypothetical protein
VTPGDGIKGPGQETASAFALPPPSRDFDGGLLRRWSYDLTAEDALALLRRPAPLPRWQRTGFGGASLCWGALIALSPPGLVGVWGSARFVVVLAVVPAVAAILFFVLRDIARRRQAQRWIPQPRQATLEEWIDCIAITRIDGTDEDYLSPELIAGVALTRHHLWVHGPNGPLIVPVRAFASPAEASEVAGHILKLSKGPYYFDP